MKTQDNKEKPTPSGDKLVELVAGPLCGSMVKWPPRQRMAKYNYYGGIATYEYEGNGKAICKLTP